MSRPLRIQYEGALYHVTSRGNARQDIFLDDKDRRSFLDCLARIVDRFGWICHAYCLMTNHYHVLIETPRANLSQGMHLLNSIQSQAFNRRHKRVGHVLQGRYKSILIEKESHLLEVARYVVLNPVRAKIVQHPEEYPWSSYCETAGECTPLGFVETRWLLAQFDSTHSKARGAYRRFVKEGINVSLWDELKSGIVLGSDEFAKKAQELARDWESHPEITKKQQHPSQRPLSKILEGCESDRALRNQLLYEAVIHEGHTQTAVAKHIGLHPATVSRIVKQINESGENA